MGSTAVRWLLLPAGLLASGSAHALTSNCGGRPCNTVGPVKDGQVIPSDPFAIRGDLFTSRFTDLALAGGAQRVDLGFSMNLGFGLVSSLYVNTNGAVTFGAPLPSRFAADTLAASVPIRNLSELGVPVIAPYYASLALGAGSGDGTLQAGDVVVQSGEADPYPDAGGLFSSGDSRQAVRITWYGLGAGGGDAPEARSDAAGATGLVYAQLLLSADHGGLSSFEFRYGPTGSPHQIDYGSLAGFALGNTQVQFTGPYQSGVPSFFEFSDGVYIGQFGTAIAGVPEPATWATMLVGFALVGGALRRRRASGLRPVTA